MAANDDVLIIGKLEDGDLRKAISELVNYVGNQTSVMASQFVTSMDLMKGAMKDFAVTQKVSVDLMKESWKTMSASFDAMFAAQSAATGGGKGSGKAAYADNTIGALEQEIALLEKERKDLELNTDELRNQNKVIEEQRKLLSEQKGLSTQAEAAKKIRKELGDAMTMPSKNLADAQAKLSELERLQHKYAGTTQLSVQQQNRLTTAIQNTKEKIDKLTSTKPKTLKDVIGMDESSLDAVARKMRALKLVSVNPNDKNQIRDIGNEYARLSRLQAELMGKNIQLTHSNNYLAQSFGYIRNRIVYALTLGAITNFTKEIYEIRGQYELLERSLGILIDDMRRGSEIFNELNAMALKSPFTLMELATGAKQLLAYNFAEEEVVDTTRRLADISAALGVPMERLVYNLGQIRAQTVLNARDARDFANAGLAIVPMLAQMYTEEKRFGDEIVTTSQVFDMMSKKMVSYADVMKVINKVTDEGGKFFDFQAKQADTLKVKMANLTLAWNNMLNEIGQDNQDLLGAPLKGLKLLFENWRAVASVIKELIVVFGTYKAVAITVSLVNKSLAAWEAVKAFFQLAKSVKTARDAMALFNLTCQTNVFGLLISAVAAAIGMFTLFRNSVDDSSDNIEKFGKAGAKAVRDTKTLFNTLQNISKESSNYKKVMGELNSILGEYNIEQIKETDTIEQVNKKREVAISLIKQEALERKYLNDIEQGNERYETSTQQAKKEMRDSLKSAMTESIFLSGNEEIRQNADAIANIISDIVENNIMLIADKTGDEYEKGLDKIYEKIQERMLKIGISKETVSKAWLDDSLFFHSNIVADFIKKIKEAKEAQDKYNTALEKSYNAEKEAAEQGATFNDRVEQTQNSLIKAANDTEKFTKKIEELLKQYGGQNIIDFLVKIRTSGAPEWMKKMGIKELAQLAARFTALATNAQKAGKQSVDFGNGKVYTTQQLFERAAQYRQAYEEKIAEAEARKSTTLRREASEALKEYKEALEAADIARNKFKKGTADQTLVTEKETAAQEAYNKALKAGVSEEELRKAKNKGGRGSKKDVLGDALTKEIQLITDIRKRYEDYKKEGVDTQTAIAKATDMYGSSLKNVKKTLGKYGIGGLEGADVANMEMRDLVAKLQEMKRLAETQGNTKGVEAIEKAINNLNGEITKVDYKRITDGLNNELSKLKEDYELGIELDANPELGSIFADMFDIDLDTLPKNAEEYAAQYTKLLNQYLKENKSTLELPNLLNLTKDDMAMFKEQMEKGEINEKWYDAILKGYLATRDVRKKEVTDTMKDWNTLLEKYAEYETKMTNIAQDAEREREIAIAKGAPQWLLDAIENMKKQRQAQASFEEFQKRPEWLVATGDLAGMTNESLQGLVNTLEDFKKKGGLTEKQTKQINKAIVALHKQIRKGNPFHAIADAMDEANMRASVYDEKLEETSNLIDSYMSRLSDLSEDEKKKLKQLIDEYNKLLKLKERDSKVDASTIVNGINDAINAAKQATGIFTDMMDALSGTNGSLAAKRINQIVGVLEKGGQGASIGAQFGGYGALIGGVAGTLSGLVTTFWDEWSGNASITDAVNESVNAVKDLENAYKRLSYAAEQYYGATSIAAKETTKSLKEMELVELRRQLQLEQSRDSKNRDEERIRDLRSEIVDLEQEIANATKETINDLLSISSHADFFESLISDMISAFKNGEDAMDAFEQKWASMIDSMVTKLILGQVLQHWVKTVEEGAQSIVEKYTGDNAREISELESKIEKIESSDAYDAVKYIIDNESDAWNQIAKQLGLEGLDWRDPRIWSQVDTIRDMYIEMLKKQLSYANSQSSSLSVNATEELLDYYTQAGEEFKEKYAQAIIDKIAGYYTFGQDAASNQMSALQQGIQGVTETTAGAIEAYLNGVSQQVYLHNELLTQIRDAVDNMSGDAMLGSVSQILLQLQTSYQTQQAIQGILEGWSNPSGQAVKVELIS